MLCQDAAFAALRWNGELTKSDMRSRMRGVSASYRSYSPYSNKRCLQRPIKFSAASTLRYSAERILDECH